MVCCRGSLATDHLHLKDAPAFKGQRYLRNPAVTRGLAEMRKVVNAILTRYGKNPSSSVLNWAANSKNLPRSELNSQKISSKLPARSRDAAVQVLINDHGFEESEIREADKQKYLLYREQNGFCPYCGSHMDPSGMRSGSLHIDHIIPVSICLDDGGMLNKTLCHAVLQHAKGKQTYPRADMGGRSKETTPRSNWRSLSSTPHISVRRFGWTDENLREHYGDENGGFTRRQLQDTQYASRLAAEYLGLLYGGVIDEHRTRRVQTPSGGVTAILREEWGLNGIVPSLPDSPAADQSQRRACRGRSPLRTDHRHHAVDAVMIALHRATYRRFA